MPCRIPVDQLSVIPAKACDVIDNILRALFKREKDPGLVHFHNTMEEKLVGQHGFAGARTTGNQILHPVPEFPRASWECGGWCPSYCDTTRLHSVPSAVSFIVFFIPVVFFELIVFFFNSVSCYSIRARRFSRQVDRNPGIRSLDISIVTG